MIAGVGAATPLPETPTEALGVAGSLEVSAIAPASAPTSAGAYVTVTTWLAPAATLKEAEESVYSALVPDARARVPVSGALPGLEMVKVFALWVPVVTLPNASDAGLTASLGAEGTCPVPETSRLTTGLVTSLLVKARQPVSAPAPVGAYVTVTVALPPAATVIGPPGDQANSSLVTGVVQRAICETVSGAVPVLRTCAVSEAVPPVATVPNASEAGASEMFGAGAAMPVPETPTLTFAFVASFVLTEIAPESALVSVGA